MLVGAAVRSPLLVGNRFHPDEALFASYARAIVTGQDPILATRWVDRPPTSFYLMAGAMALSGQNEFAARLPNFFASLVTLSLTWRLARLLWHDNAMALVAAGFVALSPLAVAFGATAFTDPLLVLWLMATLVAVADGRWGWAGLWFGLALGTKQSALFFLPLVIGIGACHWRRAGLLRFAVLVAILVLAFVLWDTARCPEVGFWMVGLTVGSPHRLIRSSEVWPRAQAWLGWLRYLFGWPPLAIFGLFLPVTIWGGQARRTRGAIATLTLLSYLIGYLAAYWLTAFNVFDRYLLPLVPLAGLLVGRVFGFLMQRNTSRLAALVLVILSFAQLLEPAWLAAHDSCPIGGDHGAYDGIDYVAAFLDEQPVGTVVYDYWLGWPLSYYLFDVYVYVYWFPSPTDLTQDLLAHFEPGHPRYLVWPVWASLAEPLDAIHAAGLEATSALVTYNRHGDQSFVVYQIALPTGEDMP